MKDSSLKFIADISSNWYKNNLDKTKKVIDSAAKSGANYIKFQLFRANTLINQKAFFKIGKLSHQSKWDKSIYQIYKDYELPEKWLIPLQRCCLNNGVEFMCTVYDYRYLDLINELVNIHKVGSGDISYYPLLEKIATYKKITLIGTGASNEEEIEKARGIFLDFDYCFFSSNLIFMKCNTNYENKKNNLKYLNLSAIKKYSFKGLSDHNKQIEPIYKALDYGIVWVERHFKMENLNSPDNNFSMNPKEWKIMVKKSHEYLEMDGNGELKIEENEKDARIIQRRNHFDWKRPDLEYMKGLNKWK